MANLAFLPRREKSPFSVTSHPPAHSDAGFAEHGSLLDRYLNGPLPHVLDLRGFPRSKPERYKGQRSLRLSTQRRSTPTSNATISPVDRTRRRRKPPMRSYRTGGGGAEEHGRPPSRSSSADLDEDDEEEQAQFSQDIIGTSTSVAEAQQRKKRTRQLTTPAQAAELHKLYLATRFPSTQMREELAERIGMTPRQVQIWFQNQRQKAKKDTPAGGTALMPPSHRPHEPYPNVVPVQIPAQMSGGQYDVTEGPYVPQHRRHPSTLSPPSDPPRQLSHEGWVSSHPPSIDSRSQPERLRGPGVPGDPYPPMRPDSPSSRYGGMQYRRGSGPSGGSPSVNRDAPFPENTHHPRPPSRYESHAQLPPLSIPSPSGRPRQPTNIPPRHSVSTQQYYGTEQPPSGIPPPFTMEPPPIWSNTPPSGSPSSPFPRSSGYVNRRESQHVESDVVTRDRRHSVASSSRRTGTMYDPVHDFHNGSPGPSR